MIFRAALAFSLVLLAAPHPRPVQSGRPATAPVAEALDVAPCNQSDTWLCGPLHAVENLRDGLVAGTDRVRDDLHAQRSHPRPGPPVF